jgi:hypothetical protein
MDLRTRLEKQIINDANEYGDTTVLYSLLELLSDDQVYNALSDENQPKFMCNNCHELFTRGEIRTDEDGDDYCFDCK